MSGRFDAIVVGAGFAGVTAARELEARGRRTLLLEARDRLGGRTWTSSLAGRSVELGGAWVHWFQPHVWAEITRYGLAVVEDDLPDVWLAPADDGVCAVDLKEAFDRLGALSSSFFEGAREYLGRPHELLPDDGRLHPLDRLSLRDRFDQLRLSPDDECWLSAVLTIAAGAGDPGVAFTTVARWWALSGWSFETFWDCLAGYRLRAGTAALLDAMLADAAPELRLGTPVASIRDDGREVEVTTRDGERFTASRVVVAVPVSLWPSIDFTPRLPAAHRAAALAGHAAAPGSSKVLIHARGDLRRFCARVPADSPVTMLSTYAELDDGQLLVGLTRDDALDFADVEAVGAAVRRLLPDADVVDVKGHDWAGDEFSGGGRALLRPGVLSTRLRVLQRPHGRVAFATSDIASGWSGLIDGAVESGLRAAAAVAANGRA